MSNSTSNLDGVAAKGMAWAGLAVISMKFMSVLSQVVLGVILSVEVYAIYAAASAAFIIVKGFQDAGVNRIIIQQQDRYDEVAGDLGGLAIYLGVIGAILLAAFSHFLSDIYKFPTLIYVLSISALTIPLMVWNSLQMARLNIQMRFKLRSLLTAIQSFLYYLVLIGCAALGYGEYSFAIATLAAAIFLAIVYLRKIGPAPVKFRVPFFKIKSFFRPLKWTILSSYFFGLAQNGDYLVLGFFLEAYELGQYFFGFMITANISLLLAFPVSQTLMPMFSKLQNDMRQTQRQFLNTSQLCIFMACCFSLAIIGFIPEALRYFFAGKWDIAGTVAVIMAVVMPLRVCEPLAIAALEGRGKWRSRTAFLAYDGLGLMLFASIGSFFLGGVLGAAIFVAFHRAVSTLIVYPYAMKTIDFTITNSLAQIFRNLWPFAVSAGLLFFVKENYLDRSDEMLHQLGVAFVYTLVIGVLYLLIAFFNTRQVFDLLFGSLIKVMNRGTPKNAKHKALAERASSEEDYNNENCYVLGVLTGHEGYGIKRGWITLLSGFVKGQKSSQAAILSTSKLEEKFAALNIPTHKLSSKYKSSVTSLPVLKEFALFLRLVKQLRLVSKLTHLGRVNRVDRLLVRSPLEIFLISLTAHKLKIKAYWLLPNGLSQHWPFDLNQRICHFLFKNRNLIPISNSHYTNSTLGEGDFERHVCHLGIDSQEFDPDAEPVLKRSDYGLPEGQIVLGMFARVVPTKGHCLLIESLAEFCRVNPNIYVLVCGGPLTTKYAKKVMKLCKEKGLQDRFFFVGEKRDVVEHYRLCDVVLNTRIDAEPFGFTVIESMMMGIPVLAHKAGGPGETIIDGTTGWLIEEATVPHMVKGFQRMLDDQDRWKEMGGHAREHALKNYTQEHFVNRLIDIFESNKNKSNRPQ